MRGKKFPGNITNTDPAGTKSLSTRWATGFRNPLNTCWAVSSAGELPIWSLDKAASKNKKKLTVKKNLKKKNSIHELTGAYIMRFHSGV